MTQVWHQANADLESGIIAEFESKLDESKKPNPTDFRTALGGLKKLRGLMDEYGSGLEAMASLNAACRHQESLVDALAGVLSESRSFPRLARSGVRYADAAGLATQRMSPLRTLDDLLQARLVDLKILAKTLDEVITGLEDAMPLAEKGEFAAVMLSGRNAFGDKNPQFTDMFSAYHRFYVQAVLATITATMQVYPKGYEWLDGYTP